MMLGHWALTGRSKAKEKGSGSQGVTDKEREELKGRREMVVYI
jgi:hypothetical protein